MVLYVQRADSRPMRLRHKHTRLVRMGFGCKARTSASDDCSRLLTAACRAQAEQVGLCGPVPIPRSDVRFSYLFRRRGVDVSGLIELGVSLSSRPSLSSHLRERHDIYPGRKSAVADDTLPIFPAGPRLYSTPSIPSDI